MFGMSSIDFWEGEPQLYWAYRFSYIEKIRQEAKVEQERLKLKSWLYGSTFEMACEIAINNCFSKQRKDFPSYNEFFSKEKEQDNQILNDLKEQLHGITDEDVRQQIEYNYWARL